MSNPSKPSRPVGINHLVLNVRDMEESHSFWTDILGYEQVGELHPQPDDKNPMNMRFYCGTADGAHHDIALVEQPDMPESPEKWSMYRSPLAVNHIAIAYPDRESWLAQMEHMKARGVPFNLRIDHGMTHSLYSNDPNGYGIEVLYELPRDVWEHDLDGALNYAEVLPVDQAMVDDVDYPRDFAAKD